MMNNNDLKKQIGMYVHIPFCIQKCRYCDFLSAPADKLTRQKYIKALIEEIRRAPVLLGDEYVMKSVFFGGGTPSAIDAQMIAEVLRELLIHFKEIIAKDEYGNSCMEISIECNPGTVTKEKLEIYKSAGFNRISFGLQSANDCELNEIGRIHTWKDFLDGYELARSAGFDNINVDLMFGLPGQTVESWKSTLESVCALKPSHISAYSLILEEGTPLASQIEKEEDRGIYRLPDEETEREMYYYVCRYLESQGYEQYEISNFAMPNRKSLHNLSYWECREYLGFGIGAASNFKDMRYKNISSLQKYINLEFDEKEELEHLSENDRMSEFVFLGLRKTGDGISKAEFEERFGVKFDDIFGNVAKRYIDEQMLSENNGRIALTRRGIDVSNVIMADFILDKNFT